MRAGRSGSLFLCVLVCVLADDVQQIAQKTVGYIYGNLPKIIQPVQKTLMKAG